MMQLRCVRRLRRLTQIESFMLGCGLTPALDDGAVVIPNGDGKRDGIVHFGGQGGRDAPVVSLVFHLWLLQTQHFVDQRPIVI